jgi:hypothetical protein
MTWQKAQRCCLLPGSPMLFCLSHMKIIKIQPHFKACVAAFDPKNNTFE